MSMTNLLTFTPWPALSAVILVVLLVAALYFARTTAHQAIHAACGALARGVRLASHSVTQAEHGLVARNRAVLLAAGREAKERIVDAQLARRGATAPKDLAGDPEPHRTVT